MVLLIDNYDSFTYNIVYLLQNLNIKTTVFTHDVSLNKLKKESFSHLIISPGPCSPTESKVCLEAIPYFAPHKKILGICLGHQSIAHVFGGCVTNLKEPRHGKTGHLYFKETPLFDGLKQGNPIALYHSLYVSDPGNCDVLAVDEKNIIMALKHKTFECYGIQFHPEAILQVKGIRIMKNFLAM